MPMAIKITPPKMLALPARRVPAVLPIFKPPMQIAKVTAAMIRDAARAVMQL